MKTKTIIEYGAVDLTAKPDSQPTSSNAQSFAPASNLKNDVEEIRYSTLEKNYFVLDGSFTHLPDTIGNIGYWSLARTGANKEFSTPITLTINFTKDHSSIGLTLRFAKLSYCTHLKIAYYNSSNTLMEQSDFYPDNFEYFCEQLVINYRKIIITFYSTNEADRYIKLYNIMYGTGVIFEGDSLISANLIEEINPLSDELTINTLDFVCFTTDDRFNILNPQGIYLTFQKAQQLKAYREENGEQELMGTFYLDEWENESEKSMRIRGIDLIGMMDKVEFNGGIYNNVSATTLIENILAKANILDYNIENIDGETITGHIPICTCREALQQVLFTLGAIADCSRSEQLNIYKLKPATTPKEIQSNTILKGTKKIKQGEIVTGISVTTHAYKLKREVETIYEEDLAAGTYKIIFDRPAANLSITGGTITESGVNYAIINATGSSSASSKYYGDKTVTITANTYDDLTSTVTITDGENHDKTNILTITDCTLINSTNANTIATRLLNYYKNLYEDSLEIILGTEKAGDNIITERSDINHLDGYVTRLDIDMTGGFLANANIIAKVSE